MNEINDARPSSLSHIIGQRSVVEQVKVAIDAAFTDGTPVSSCLLCGPPGVGKSQLAEVIAQEMAADFHEVLGQSIRSPADLNALLLEAKDRAVVHIDECHEMRKDFQTALYLAIDKRQVFANIGGRTPQGIPIANFTLLLSTTDEYALLQPLRDRMKLVLRFEFYSVEELAELTRLRARGLGWEIDGELLLQIAGRSKGTPRLALRLLQACRRVCRSQGENVIGREHLERACSLEGIDELGLGRTEQRYLEIVADGSTRLNVIASMLGLPTRTVSQVTEPFLIRGGLILKDDQGRRQLTAMGRELVQRQMKEVASD